MNNNFRSYEWASLPPGRYGQPAKTMDEALALYDKYYKEELSVKSDLHLKQGFLKDFYSECCCQYNQVCSIDSKYNIDKAVATEEYTPQKGDIVVIQNIDNHPHGHIAIYNGEHWISDFEQRDFGGGQSYRTIKPKHTFFRWKQ